MNLLLLNAYDGGSHRAFAAGWRDHSRHRITIAGLPARHWKWRMRHAAHTLAQQAAALEASFDALVATDMLDLAAFRGLAPAALRDLPTVLYFHENQLTYPDDHRQARDYHFAFTNLYSAAAATEVWFNSVYHQGVLVAAWRELLGRMPDYPPLTIVNAVEATSRVMPPGIALRPYRARAPRRACHLLWAARWEADKDPQTFFEALELLAARGVDFRVSVLGRASRHEPAVFAQARQRLGARVVHWGWLDRSLSQPAPGSGGPSARSSLRPANAPDDRLSYEQALDEADVVVSTARHEFFGIAVAEAIAAGAFPVVPDRLAYPELLGPSLADQGCLYQGDAESLANRLAELCRLHDEGRLWAGDPERGRRAVERHAWSHAAARMDARLDELCAVAA